jgi:phage terminase small subunit
MPDNNIAPIKCTPKELQFATAYIETGNAAEAYRLAYDTSGNDATARRNAFTVLHRPRVTAEIERLQSEHRTRHNVTVDRLTEELEIARQLALQNKNASAAVSATMGKARLHGLLVDKQEQIQRPNVSFQMILPHEEGDEA